MNKARSLSLCSILAALVGNCLLSPPAFAAEMPNESEMGLAWSIPFIGLLITIALGQALCPTIWLRHYGKLTAFWIVTVAVPMLATMGAAALVSLARLLVLEYVPFIVSIFTLYVIAGGIRVRTRMSGHPGENAFLLFFGAMASGLLGTPGATMLLLPVLLTSNRWRRHKVPVVVFLIFIVCNIGVV